MDIHELVRELKRTHRPGDLYRGQNLDRPVMLPSLYRPLAADLTKSVAVVPIDEKKWEELLRSDRRVQLKYSVFDQLIKDFGIGLGNIVAQQYGLTSEALDVSHEIDVAAYFATRKYPVYSHIEGPGAGVIYRFRELTSDGLDADYSLYDLGQHFEAGMSERGYYDFFVRQDRQETVFDRDKWWGVVPADEREVWTVRLVTDWPSLWHAMGKDENRPWMRGIYNSRTRHFDWKLTRFASQSGGMIRPRVYWRARVPARFRVAADPNEAQEIRLAGRAGPGFLRSPPFRGKWPLVIPSAAIKLHLIGVENIRAHPACMPHFFEHSSQRVTGFYRRELWPEPSDDPMYGGLWQLALDAIWHERSFSSELPPDDAKEGVLDRGYRLDNEQYTRDARHNDDLMRGQLEDADENLQYGEQRALDHLRRMSPLSHRNDELGSMRAAVRGLRIAPEDPDLLQGLAASFEDRSKPNWARKTVERALSIAPRHPWLLYMKAMDITRQGRLAEAKSIIGKAIKLYDPVLHKYTDFHFLELHAVLLLAMRKGRQFARVAAQMRAKQYSTYEIVRQVEWLWDRFPALRPPRFSAMERAVRALSPRRRT
jgi:tetratricopeptide (TPR) repeat protein